MPSSNFLIASLATLAAASPFPFVERGAVGDDFALYAYGPGIGGAIVLSAGCEGIGDCVKYWKLTINTATVYLGDGSQLNSTQSAPIICKSLYLFYPRYSEFFQELTIAPLQSSPRDRRHLVWLG